jgi:regulator of protease activity HflC (stomatin/prohibitin superfamily)
MVVSTGDFRSLLSGAFWLVVSAIVVALLYGIGANSSITIAIALQLFPVLMVTRAVRELHQKRDFAATAQTAAFGDPSQQPSAVSAELEGAPLATARTSQPRAPAPSNHLVSDIQAQSSLLMAVTLFDSLFAGLLLLQLEPEQIRMPEDDLVVGIVCLGAAFVWLVLARSFQTIKQQELPEAADLMSAFREAQWGSLIAGAGLMSTSLGSQPVFWATRLLLFWVIVMGTETLVRWLIRMLVPAAPGEPAVAPVQSLAREAIFAAANPVTSLVRTFERRCGVSVRSSWAIAFVGNLTVPLLVLLLLLGWGLTSLVIVETHEWGVRESFGRKAGGPLLPGLHLTLPWPFGRIRTFAVKPVHQLPIGYVEADEELVTNRPRALLWTRPHAKEEFALVLGDGSELVAVNAIVYFKISEVPEEFFDYVYGQSDPEQGLTAYAYRALMEQTRGRTLDDVLAANRAEFARRVVDSVREQAKAARLGLEVVDFALVNLHPPIEAGAEFLEVINAKLDARRRVTEAAGERQVALQDSATRSLKAIATARIEASRRVAGALSEVAEFKSIGQAHQDRPRTLRLRLWIESLENALSDQRLFLIDSALIDAGAEMLLDTRLLDAPRSPALDAPSPFFPTGPKPNE